MPVKWYYRSQKASQLVTTRGSWPSLQTCQQCPVLAGDWCQATCGARGSPGPQGWARGLSQLHLDGRGLFLSPGQRAPGTAFRPWGQSCRQQVSDSREPQDLDKTRPTQGQRSRPSCTSEAVPCRSGRQRTPGAGPARGAVGAHPSLRGAWCYLLSPSCSVLVNILTVVILGSLPVNLGIWVTCGPFLSLYISSFQACGPASPVES